MQLDVNQTISSLVKQDEYDQAIAAHADMKSKIAVWEKKVTEWEKQTRLAKEYGEAVKRKDEDIKKLASEITKLDTLSKDSLKQIEYYSKEIKKLEGSNRVEAAKEAAATARKFLKFKLI